MKTLDELIPDDAKLTLSFETWSTKEPDGVKWSTFITGADLKAALRSEMREIVKEALNKHCDSNWHRSYHEQD